MSTALISVNIPALILATLLTPAHVEDNCFAKADALRESERRGYVLVAAGPTSLGGRFEFYMVPGTEQWATWFQTPDRQWMCPVAHGEGWRSYYPPAGQGS